MTSIRTTACLSILLMSNKSTTRLGTISVECFQLLRSEQISQYNHIILHGYQAVAVSSSGPSLKSPAIVDWQIGDRSEFSSSQIGVLIQE